MMADEAEITGAGAKTKADEAETTNENQEGTPSRRTGAKMIADEAQTPSASASTVEKPSGREFEVFLNFRGPDSRLTVVDVLCDALKSAGIRFFYDDEDESIRKGEVIKNELMEAITNSKIYIPIFSPNYASSKWCLLELEEIINCWESSQKQEDKKTILPIFCDVSSDDVKLKTKVYEDALGKIKNEHSEGKLKDWKIALQKAASIKGWNMRDHGLLGLAKLIVEEVCRKL
jgi:hypothetical protein